MSSPSKRTGLTCKTRAPDALGMGAVAKTRESIPLLAAHVCEPLTCMLKMLVEPLVIELSKGNTRESQYF